MLFSLGIVILVGLSVAAIVEKIKLPRIIGMLITGIIIGPYALDLIDATVLNISAELRQIALIIILVKAGLSLDLSDLKKVGRSAVMMSFVPASLEICGYLAFAPILLGINRIDAAVMGAVLSAVSPAVVVPRTVKLIEEKRGTAKGIPQMILAGASCDDIFVIVLFSAFITMAQGGAVNAVAFIDIPVSIVLGTAMGTVVGFVLCFVFENKKNSKMRNTSKAIIILAASFLLMSAENILKPYAAVSGYLAVVATACVIKLKARRQTSRRLSEKFGKLWIFAEVLLFVLVGAAVDVRYMLNVGFSVVVMIAVALMCRCVGVWLCTIKTELNFKERLFCMIAYIPKATVQAAIGSVPLSQGLACGKAVLSVAVAAILITAPLGAIGMDNCAKSLLSDDTHSGA